MDPINQYSNNSPAFDVSLNSNVDDGNHSKLIQENATSLLSKKRLFSEVNNEKLGSNKPLKKSKVHQRPIVSFLDPKNSLLKIYPKLQSIPDPCANETIVLPGPDGKKHFFSVRRRSLEKISLVYKKKTLRILGMAVHGKKIIRKTKIVIIT